MPTYTLKYPLKAGPSKEKDSVAQYEKESFDTLTFRALTVDDMLGSDDHPGEQHTRAFYMSELSGISLRVLKRMDPIDWNGASRVILQIVNRENRTD